MKASKTEKTGDRQDSDTDGKKVWNKFCSGDEHNFSVSEVCIRNVACVLFTYSNITIHIFVDTIHMFQMWDIVKTNLTLKHMKRCVTG